MTAQRYVTTCSRLLDRPRRQKDALSRSCTDPKPKKDSRIDTTPIYRPREVVPSRVRGHLRWRTDVTDLHGCVAKGQWLGGPHQWREGPCRHARLTPWLSEFAWSLSWIYSNYPTDGNNRRRTWPSYVAPGKPFIPNPPWCLWKEINKNVKERKDYMSL